MKTSLVTLAIACAMASSAAAQTKALGVNIGTPGVGVQAAAQINDSSSCAARSTG